MIDKVDQSKNVPLSPSNQIVNGPNSSTKKNFRPSVDSIIEQFPELKKFITLTATNCERQNVRSLEDAVLSTAKSFRIIYSEETQINNAIRLTKETISKIKQRNDISLDIKIILDLKYKEDIKKYKYKKKFLQHQIQLIQNVTEIANIIRIDKLHYKLNVNTELFNDAIIKGPDCSLFEKHKKQLSQLIKNVSHDTINKVNAKMKEVFALCDKFFDKDLDFIEDDGLKVFWSAIDLMSPNFKMMLNNTVASIPKHPENSGKDILLLTEKFIEISDVSHNNVLRYLFLMFTRLIFNRIYNEKLALHFMSVDFPFQIRIRQLKKFKPSMFPSSLKFLPVELYDIPVKEFPIDFIYSDCIKEIQFLQFEACPIDFSMACYKCLNQIQELASRVVFSKNVGTHKNREDFALGFDELVDITLVLVIYAEPFELYHMTKLLKPYVSGLKLSSQLEFGFMLINSVCEQIMKLDMDKIQALSEKEIPVEKKPSNLDKSNQEENSGQTVSNQESITNDDNNEEVKTSIDENNHESDYKNDDVTKISDNENHNNDNDEVEKNSNNEDDNNHLSETNNNAEKPADEANYVELVDHETNENLKNKTENHEDIKENSKIE